MTDLQFVYEGEELALFANAVNWRSYWAKQISHFLGKRVLEVGAGLGSVTKSLCSEHIEYWCALEPDSAMAAKLETFKSLSLPEYVEVKNGTTSDLDSNNKFDTILYIDVLEHIEDDQSELVGASRLISEGGCLIVLSPAHQYLYTPFDKAIGHFRRYNKQDFKTFSLPEMILIESKYLDSVGMLASLGNKLILHSSQPKSSQIELWDTKMVPLSRYLDKALNYSLGKSVLGVWRKC